MGLFSKIKQGLLKTKQQMVSKIETILNSFTKIDEDLFEQLEETLIMSDVGVETSIKICEELRKKIKERGITNPSLIMDLIHEVVADMMGTDLELDLENKPAIILVIGVNGVGKTTTIGKLCYKFKNEGKKVLVAAADTFRAAAIDQLEIWTNRADVDIVKHAEGSDPAAVVFDAISAAKARNSDVLIVDTAGRLHNKKNLMAELAKINRIITQQSENSSKEILLVLDATTGQNAVNQARLFKEVAEITGIVLTKLDGTAKGGIVISIKNELDIPVKLVGLGEKIDDLQDFSSKDFVNALFGDSLTKDANEKVEDDQNEVIEEVESYYNEESIQLNEHEDLEETQESSDVFEEVKQEIDESVDNFVEVNKFDIYDEIELPENEIINEVFEESLDEEEQVEEDELEEKETENVKKKKFGFGWFKKKKK